MRIRNIKDKDKILSNSHYVILDPSTHKGKWSLAFGNDNPICVEIGPGKCKFIYEMARLYPNINFIGVERIDTVLALGIKEISNNPCVNNLRLINFDATKIDDIFDNEVDTLYLNFSDPWPKARHEKRRLTSFGFLKKYDIMFLGDKKIVFKTDNRDLFEYSVVSISNYGYTIDDISLDLHSRKNYDNVMTEYENKFSSRGFNIYMLKAVKKL